MIESRSTATRLQAVFHTLDLSFCSGISDVSGLAQSLNTLYSLDSGSENARTRTISNQNSSRTNFEKILRSITRTDDIVYYIH